MTVTARPTIAAELSSRAKISSPNPVCCCVCLTSSSPEVRFIDFGVRADVGTIVDAVSGGVLARLDKIEICDACIREAAEVLEYIPSLHRLHVTTVQRLQRECDELEEENRQLHEMLARAKGV